VPSRQLNAQSEDEQKRAPDELEKVGAGIPHLASNQIGKLKPVGRIIGRASGRAYA
jgi:hypothetical protein